MALSLFAKKQPVSEPIEDRGGKYILRQSIALRVKKHENLQSLSLTLNVPPDGIIAFSNGADNLDENQLSAMATYVFGNATYSAELDRLISNNKPATNMGVAPLPYVPTAMAGAQYPAPFTPRAEIAAAPPAPDLVGAGLSKPYRKAEGWA